MPRLQIDRQTTLHFLDAGAAAGPPVILLHCSAGSGAAWLRVIAALQTDWRLLAPDLLGYGETIGWSPGQPMRLDDELRLLEALLNHVGGRAHLIGHSYGGALALSAARRFGSRIASLAVIEPVSFQMLRLADEQDGWAEIAALGTTTMALVAAGDAAAAAQGFTDYWMGRGCWNALPRARQAPIVASMAKVAAEWSLAFESAEAATHFAGLAMPCLLLCGSRTRQPPRRVLTLLRQALPTARYAEIDGAGHMAPITHPEIVAAVLRQHIAAQAATPAAA
jgi:pimeloyl-ACP methyl ester carboxylesterase